ncbi:MAG TPA: MaoC/PaaZ C-terminal domain-containing protein [Paraburkholderia sp.]|jgi:acyl dehydratase
MSETVSPLAAGDVFHLSRGPVTSTQLVMYAGASGDFNRIHFDYPFAVEVGLGGVLAHGMLTMGYASSCVVAMLGEARWVRELRARFLAPVRVGDVVESTSTVREVRADGSLLIGLESRVGETVVLRGEAVAEEAR